MRIIYFMHNRFQPRVEIKHEKISFYDLTFLLEGSMHWKINGKAYTVKAGDVFLLKKDSFREREAFKDCNYYSFNFFCDEDVELPPLIEEGLTNEIRLLLSACDEIHSQVLDNSEPLEYILQALLSILTNNLKAKNSPQIVQIIKRYIAQHLHEPLHLETITDATFFSTVHCSSVFKRETGQSIIDYALDEKIKAAKQYIFQGIPLKQIATILGFGDYNYFSRIFKKRAGITPMKYKHSISSKK